MVRRRTLIPPLRGGRWSTLLALLPALVLAASCEPSRPAAKSCTTDGDCADGQSCTDGVCRDRTTPPPEDAGPGLQPIDAGPYARAFCPDFPFTTDDCGNPEKEMYIERRDSDEDGLSDLLELCEHSTDPCNADSDGDGVNDLIETAYGSDPHDGSDNPRERGDFVFVVPYSPPTDPPVPPTPDRDALSFGTDLQKVDVYISIDTSGSMDGEIDTLHDSFSSFIVPELAARIPDVWFGVGSFAHCPSGTCAEAMRNRQNMTSDIAAVQAAIPRGTTCGSAEPYYQNLWVLATGRPEDFDAVGTNRIDPNPRNCTDPSTIGWPCFRPDAVRLVVQVGDEPMASQSQGSECRTGNYNTHAEAAAAMNGAGVHYIGIDSSTNATLQREMRDMAIDTGSVDATTGEPIYFRIPTDGSELGENLVNAITQFTTNVPIRVDAIADNDPSNANGVDAAAAFIERLETNTSESTVEGRVCTNLTTGDDDGDGNPDHFPRVFPGTSVCFDVIPKANQSVPATEEPQIYRARIRVIGDTSTPLDEREALFLVPPVLGGPI